MLSDTGTVALIVGGRKCCGPSVNIAHVEDVFLPCVVALVSGTCVVGRLAVLVAPPRHRNQKCNAVEQIKPS